MNFRISNAHTAFFSSKEEYVTYLKSWKARVQTKTLVAEDFLVHAMLTGKGLYRAFSPRKSTKHPGELPYVTLADLTYWVNVSAGADSTGNPTPHSRLSEFLVANRKILREKHSVIANGEMAELTVEGV